MAATTTMVHVRMDVRIKAEAEKALRTMGLSVSDAVRVLLTRVAAEKALPFEVRVPNVATRTAIEEPRRDELKYYPNVDELAVDLNAPDPADL